jgi:DNA-binding transcriptional regulator YiaG
MGRRLTEGKSMKLKHEELLQLVIEPVSKWNKNTWPKKVREWREKNQFSRSDFSKMLGLSEQALWRFENGERVPSGSTVRLLELFGVFEGK